VNPHEKYMQRCFQLAAKALGNTYPNPLVGCVIVANDSIIGEGFHQKAGGPHAEVEAIRSITNEALLEGATVYVNLEPCAHHGRTPPCADLLILSKVKRVVIANTDPFPQVSGRGIERLRAAGIEVITDVLATEGAILNRRFFSQWQKHRPYIILKWAQTADGFMDKERKPGETGSFRISGDAATRMVHLWRSQEQAILVGYNTAATDNPRLNVRHVKGNDPMRIAIDPKLELPRSLHLFHGEQPALILRGSGPDEWVEEMQKAGVQSVIVEGGASTLHAFINAGLWDEARVIHSPMRIQRGLKAPVIAEPFTRVEKCGPDTIYHFFSQ
jgi:diaminohydroxyphosphoribosylaminopyrimidine deaminase / 5-amino-6-(5-phosphoribosylamino)uracil reductase